MINMIYAGFIMELDNTLHANSAISHSVTVIVLHYNNCFALLSYFSHLTRIPFPYVPGTIMTRTGKYNHYPTSKLQVMTYI